MTALALSALGVKAVAGSAPAFGTAPTTTGVTATNSPPNVDALSTVSWSFNSPDGKNQGAYRVQAQNSAQSVTHWDSGWRTGLDLSLAVDMDKNAIPAAVTKWKVSTRDISGVHAPEASSVDIDYTAWGTPTVTITTLEGVAKPADDQMTVTQATDVTLAWSFSDGANTQAQYRVRVVDPDATEFVHFDSGWTTGSGTSFDIPFTFMSGQNYSIRLQAKNNYGLRSS